MGAKVNWRSFGNGNEMTAAMVSGDVQIAYSQGLTPFVVGVTKGAPLMLVSAAVSYAENDNCIVHKDAGITQANAMDLEGRKVASPIGNVTHYKMLRTTATPGRGCEQDQPPADEPAGRRGGPRARGRGDGVRVRRRAAEDDEVRRAVDDREGAGGPSASRVFDVVSVTNDFAAEHPDLVVKFLQLTEDANNMFRMDADKMLPVIAKQAGQELEDARSMVGLFEFPTRDEQLSEAWMGGTVEEFVNEGRELLREGRVAAQGPGRLRPDIDDSFMRQ